MLGFLLAFVEETENCFHPLHCICWWEERETVYPDFAGGREEFRRRRKGGGQGVNFPADASNQISLMKWVYGVQSDGPEATDILSCAS